MYGQTRSAYGISLHSIHKASIHFKSSTTLSNETCDPRLMHLYITSLANPNMYLVSSKQIVLLWAWQYFHRTTLSTLAESKSISSTTLPRVNLFSHLHQQTIDFSCIRGETHDAPNPKLLSLALFTLHLPLSTLLEVVTVYVPLLTGLLSAPCLNSTRPCHRVIQSVLSTAALTWQTHGTVHRLHNKPGQLTLLPTYKRFYKRQDKRKIRTKKLMN